MNGPVETEVKIRLAPADPIPERLLALGFAESAARVFEVNTLYDTPDARLRNAGMLLRVRQIADRALLTWKGRDVPGPHKSRPEIETTLGSAENFHQILTRLGFEPSFLYEKYRTEYRKEPDSGVVTFDETPIGRFLELEGTPEWIDATAKLLGFTSQDYVLESYGKLYLMQCERLGVPPRNMTFEMA